MLNFQHTQINQQNGRSKIYWNASREIAELTGKQHAHVMRDIRSMLLELHGENGLSNFGSSYINEQNKEQPQFCLPKRENADALLSAIAGDDSKRNHHDQRGEGEAELRHDSFMAKVPKVLGENLVPKFIGTSFYVNGAGNKVPRTIYNFPKREA